MNRKALGLAAAAMLSTGPALAHHAFVMFDQSKLLSLSGTVKYFELVNPHCWLYVAVTNDKGETSTWSFEGGPVNQMVALGWKDSVRPGDKIDVVFYGMKNGLPGGQIMNVKMGNGQKLCSYRGCGDGTGTAPAPF